MVLKAENHTVNSRRGARNSSAARADPRCTPHRVANGFLAVCQFAAMICHLICFVVMLNKTRELQNKLGQDGACILYISAYDNGTNAAVEYNDVPCYFVTYGSLWLAAMAAYVTGFLIVRLVQVKRTYYVGLVDGIIATVVTLILSITISVGRSVTCSNFADALHGAVCADIYLYNFDNPNERVKIYKAMRSAEISSWLAFPFLLIAAVLSVLQTVIWLKKLQQSRRANASASLIRNEEQPSVDEVEKTSKL